MGSHRAHACNSSRALTLVVQQQTDREFHGRMEYPADGVTTKVEGTLNPHWLPNDQDWAHVGASSNITSRVLARFRETGYLTQGAARISFDGEYRVAFDGDSASGAWFSARRLVGSLTLRRRFR